VPEAEGDLVLVSDLLALLLGVADADSDFDGVIDGVTLIVPDLLLLVEIVAL
jgi:hypothetical protein